MEIDSNASERGVTILAASSKLPGLTSEGPSEVERADARDIFEAARSQLDETSFSSAFAAGSIMDFAELIEFALSVN